MFVDPEIARIGLSAPEAKERNLAYRLTKIPDGRCLPTRTLCETQGFMKALVDTERDRILGFTVCGVKAGEIIVAVQVAMIAGLLYPTLRDAIFTHPTLPEGTVLRRACRERFTTLTSRSPVWQVPTRLSSSLVYGTLRPHCKISKFRYLTEGERHATAL